MICAKTRKSAAPTGARRTRGSCSRCRRRGARSRLDTSAWHIGSGARRRGRAPNPPRGARPPEEVEVDLDVVDLLHAADVGAPERLECVDERTRALETRRRVDDLVAVDLAAAALGLVLRTKRQLGRARMTCSQPDRGQRPCRPQDLTFTAVERYAGGCDRSPSARGAADRVGGCCAGSSCGCSCSRPSPIVLHWVGRRRTTADFVLAALALIPLAWLIGEATEHAAEHTGRASAASSTRASATRRS